MNFVIQYDFLPCLYEFQSDLRCAMYVSQQISEPIRLKAIYSFFRHHYCGDYSFRGEMHDFWEVVCVTKGKICVTAGDQVYALSEGELIVHKPMEFHNFFVDDASGATVVIVSFSAETILGDELSQKVFSLNSFQKDLIMQVFEYLDRRRQSSEALKERWKQVDHRIESNHWFLPYMCLFEVDHHALNMASGFVSLLLLSLLESEGRSRAHQAGDVRVFRAAVDFLNICVHRSIGVEELAKEVGMSTSSLNRIFRKYAGVSVHRYYLMQKIKTATECLQAGVSVTETAQRLGFSNQSYFTACFRRETGKNPSEVLKERKKKND